MSLTCARCSGNYLGSLQCGHTDVSADARSADPEPTSHLGFDHSLWQRQQSFVVRENEPRHLVATFEAAATGQGGLIPRFSRTPVEGFRSIGGPEMPVQAYRMARGS
jgi:hypothetical protein